MISGGLYNERYFTMSVAGGSSFLFLCPGIDVSVGSRECTGDLIDALTTILWCIWVNAQYNV